MSEAGFTLGKYKLLNCIASGQTTQVWEGQEEGGSEKFAIKMILPEAFKDPDNRKILKHEAAVLKGFDHPNVIRFKEIVIKKEYGFFVMELFKTNNVKQMIQGDLVSIQSRMKRMIELTCLALGHVHDKKFIHRDIKPDNLLFNRGSDFRLVDFSLAQKRVGGLGKWLYRRKLLVQGTRTYMSPEQILGQILTPASDLYSLGITMYEIVTGKPPFQASNPKEVLKKHLEAKPIPPNESNPNLTDEMNRFILRLMSKKAKERPKDTSDFMAEFRGINLWKEPPETLVRTEKGEEKETFSLGERRDSRSDALRQEMIKQGKLPGGSGAKAPAAPAPPSPPRAPGAPPAPPTPGGVRVAAPAPPVVAPPPPPAVPVGGAPTAPRPPMAPSPVARPPAPPAAAPVPPSAVPVPPSPPGAGRPVPPGAPRPPAAPAGRPPAPPSAPQAPRPPVAPGGTDGIDDFKIS